MKHSPLQFTMRELQSSVRSSLLWAALAGAAILLGLAGPFGTYDGLALPGRLAFWAFISVTTYFCAFLIVTFISSAFFDRRPSPLWFGMIGAVSGPPVAGIVWLTNRWVFGESVISYLALTGYVTVVAVVVSATIALFSKSFAEQAPQAESQFPQRPALMDRLPLDKRGQLYHLSMQDHYVDVATSKGSHLLLMRMSDAVAETRGVDGVQIHRSHWVARDAIKRVVRDGDRVALLLVNETELPVSRARSRELREMGII